MWGEFLIRLIQKFIYLASRCPRLLDLKLHSRGFLRKTKWHLVDSFDIKFLVYFIAHTSHMDIFQNLAVDLDTEGRYLFLNCIANQLRYPNSHTQYFSCTLLYLFAEANQESIQEQITRVLLERLIVNRPHPWGKTCFYFLFFNCLAHSWYSIFQNTGNKL